MIQGQNVVHTSNPFHLSGYFELFCKNAFFYDSVVGLLTAVILLLAEFLPLREIDGQPRERRHIVSVFKLVQNLLEPSGSKGKSCFQELEAAIIQRFWTEPEAEKSPPSTQRTGWTER